MRLSSAEIGTLPNRRTILKLAAMSTFGIQHALSSQMTIEAAENQVRSEAMQVLLIWFSGGMSGREFLDPEKPGTSSEYAGPFSSVQTTSPAIRVSEPWDRLAPYGNMMTVIKDIHSGATEHGQAARFALRGGATSTLGHRWGNAMHTQKHQAPYALVHSPFEYYDFREAHMPRFALPMKWEHTADYTNYLNITEYNEDSNLDIELPVPFHAIRGRYQSALTASSELGNSNVANVASLKSRGSLLREFESTRSNLGLSLADESFEMNRELALSLLTGDCPLSKMKEPTTKELEAYGGDNYAARQVLLGRDLINRDVQFVTLSLALPHKFVDWDFHSNLEQNTLAAAGPVSAAIAALLYELREGSLRPTLVVFATEFNRTSTFNKKGGRDHSDRSNPLIMVAPPGYAIQGGSVHGERNIRGNIIGRKLESNLGAVAQSIMFAAANGNQDKFPELLGDVRQVPLGIMLHN